MSEYEDLNENTDITKFKPKDLVAGAEVSAELVGFKESSESKIQMIENEDATRNDLPSLQKRGELLTTKESSYECVDSDNGKKTDGSGMPLAFEEDKYSVRLDDALAKLDELEEESVEIKEKEEKRDKTRRELRLDSVSKYKIESNEKMPIVGKASDGKEEESGKDKGVLDLKAELDQLQIDEKEKAKAGGDDDDKSISESDTGSTVTSPKRVCNVSDSLFIYSRTPNRWVKIVRSCNNYNMLIFWI